MSEHHADQAPEGIKFHKSKLPTVARIALASSLVMGLSGDSRRPSVSSVGISATPVTEEFFGGAQAILSTEVPAHIIASYEDIGQLPVPIETLFQRAVDPELVTSAHSGVTTYAFESAVSTLGSSLAYVRNKDPRYGKGFTTYGHAITGGLPSVLPGDVFTDIDKSIFKSERGITVTVVHGVLVDGAVTDYFFIRAGAMRASFKSCFFSNPCDLDEVTDVFSEEIDGATSIVVTQE